MKFLFILLFVISCSVKINNIKLKQLDPEPGLYCEIQGEWGESIHNNIDLKAIKKLKEYKVNLMDNKTDVGFPNDNNMLWYSKNEKLTWEDYEEEPLKLECGKYYKDVQGRVWSCFNKLNSKHFKCINIATHEIDYFSITGKNEERDSSWDLVCEVVHTES